ncbi:uncharacterized protein LOC111709013 isoform X2 [Eurytemora carolleeae]|uniref:uncharacterized protein LOC111709013 isoform X2 n=1 Tax=Eurytemora carolleeae TaxID=1294199 RepID=UPI000C77959E|nr:uncharacterized protein LOC111709013 isoform X2 [Eurytemora carolleeae]|eukprot:XP_023338348.1 uncharacterized protein LOC111709013 isoform X2 [Eurytemora affinis]
MSPYRRRCLMPEETDVPELNVKLEAFDTYTQANCLIECAAAAMLKLCGCVPYYFPTLPKPFIQANVKMGKYPGSSGFCFTENLVCLGNNQGIFNAFASLDTEDGESANEGLTCNCPDDCDEIVYNKEVSSGKLKDNNDALLNTILCTRRTVLSTECWTNYYHDHCFYTMFRKEYRALKTLHRNNFKFFDYWAEDCADRQKTKVLFLASS